MLLKLKWCCIVEKIRIFVFNGLVFCIIFFCILNNFLGFFGYDFFIINLFVKMIWLFKIVRFLLGIYFIIVVFFFWGYNLFILLIIFCVNKLYFVFLLILEIILYNRVFNEFIFFIWLYNFFINFFILIFFNLVLFFFYMLL